jgi:hypothetical protein
MAANPSRRIKERRPAIWPWLVMPIIIVLVFCALRTVHQRSGDAGAAPHEPTQRSVPQPGQ